MNRKALIFIILALSLTVSSMAAGAVCPDTSALGAIGGLSDPSGVAIDSRGNVYVAQGVESKISVYSQSGRLLRDISQTEPLALAVDDSGLYATGSNGTLTIYGPELGIKAAVSTGIRIPSGVAVSADRIYVSDSLGAAIAVYDKAGQLQFRFGGDGTPFKPGALFVDSSTGNLYAVNSAVASIFIFGSDGNFISKFNSDILFTGGLLGQPRGLMLDAAGRIYVTDAMQLQVYVFDGSGSPLCSFGAAVDMCRPYAIAAGPNKVLYITDKDCGKLHIVGMDDYVKMAVSPSELSFRGQDCGTPPPAKKVTVSNEGRGVMDFTVSSDSWIKANPASGQVGAGASQDISIAVEPAGLGFGTHIGTVTVLSQGAEEKVAVTLEVVSPPSLTANPFSFSFMAKGKNLPPAENLTIELSGDSSGSAEWTASSDSGWLGVTPSKGPSDTLSMANVSVNVAGLAGGVHNGNVTIAAACATGSPIVIPVELTYIKGGTIKVSANIAEASYTITGPATYSGSGVSFAADAAPEGTYTIIFGRVNGFKPPSSYSLAVADGTITEFAGNYKDLRKKMNIIATMGKGSEAANDELRIFSSEGIRISSFIVDGKAGQRQGTSTAAADVDGDGSVEIITASGRDSVIGGYLSDGTPVKGLSFAAFTKHGAEVVTADIDGDGVAEIIAGASPEEGSPAEIRVFSFKGGSLSDTGIDFLAYQERFGVNVAAADIDGDGVAEILTTPGGTGKGDMRVRILKVNTSGGAGMWTVEDAGGFSVASDLGGSDIAAGDLDGDDIAEIIVVTASQPGAKTARVAVYKAKSGGTPVSGFDIESRAGVVIAAGDTDFNGIAEIVVADSGISKLPSRVRVYDAVGSLLRGFEAFESKGLSGIKISLGEVGR
ncbi:MAG: FG-GAP-like repeat-containing protein [Thermodesulfovibrionales bacterium]|nr:FG-GAP-like repeat-containing protein [Thermodesulfovibrionales bacterium]